MKKKQSYCGKRFFDLMLVTIMLPLLAPIIFFIWIMVIIKIGFPAFFKQVRPGINGKPFVIYKFRTMLYKYDCGKLLPDSHRITPFGCFLRSISLDELPSLWNILKGEMSLVGPRPLLMEYLPLYNEEQKKRHEVLPGMTGWAQVNGRNAISWEKKFQLDIWYVTHQSLFLDIKILLFTFKKVISREGISNAGNVTMEKFRGID